MISLKTKLFGMLQFLLLNFSFLVSLRPLTWIEERGPGMKRDKKINFCFKSECLESLPEAPRSAVGLFMQDLILFARKLLGQVSKEELEAEKRRILLCLNLAEEIQRHCEQPTNIYS